MPVSIGCDPGPSVIGSALLVPLGGRSIFFSGFTKVSTDSLLRAKTIYRRKPPSHRYQAGYVRCTRNSLAKAPGFPERSTPGRQGVLGEDDGAADGLGDGGQGRPDSPVRPGRRSSPGARPSRRAGSRRPRPGGAAPDDQPSERATAATVSASAAPAGTSSRAPSSGTSSQAARTSGASEAIRARLKSGE